VQVPVGAPVDHMLGLSIGCNVRGRIAVRTRSFIRSSGEEGEVVVAHHVRRPRQVASVPVSAAVDDVVAPIGVDEVPGRSPAGSGACEALVRS